MVSHFSVRLVILYIFIRTNLYQSQSLLAVCRQMLQSFSKRMLPKLPLLGSTAMEMSTCHIHVDVDYCTKYKQKSYIWDDSSLKHIYRHIWESLKIGAQKRHVNSTKWWFTSRWVFSCLQLRAVVEVFDIHQLIYQKNVPSRKLAYLWQLGPFIDDLPLQKWWLSIVMQQIASG